MIRMKTVRLQLLLVLTALVIFLTATTVYSTRQVLSDNYSAHRIKSQEIKSKLNNSLVEAQAFLFSLAHLHHLSITTDLADIDLLMTSRESERTGISGIGRFDRVEHSRINEYLQSLQNTGLYSYKLKSIKNESINPESSQSKHSFSLPIASIFPYTVSSTSLLGIDLGTSHALADLYLHAATHNQIQVTRKPENYNAIGDLLLIQPTYLGRYIPEDKDKLISQSDGGFIANIDIVSKLENLILDSTLNVSLSVKQISSSTDSAFGDKIKELTRLCQRLPKKRIY